MEKLAVLEKKLGKLLDESAKLSRENEKLRSQLRFVGSETGKSRRILQEYKSLQEEKEFIRKKLDNILGKFKKLKI